MLIDAVSDSRAVAAMMPTGAEALQFKDRAKAAGTEGPPIQAPTRFEKPERPTEAIQRPVRLGGEGGSDEPSDANSASIMEAKVQKNNEVFEGNIQERDRKQVELAKAAFEQTQELARQQTERAAKIMRERY